MSYNIDSVTLLSCVVPLRISREAAARWAAGDASFLLTWEGGDSQTGLRIADGKAYEHKVDIALGDVVAELEGGG